MASDVVGPDTATLTLVYLHGLTTASAMSAGLIAAVAGHGVRVASVDLRGHGRSPHAERYRHDDYAEDVAAAIEQITMPPVVIYGHSMGGVIAVSLAQRRPDLVSALVLGDPPVYLGDPELRAADPVTATFAGFVEAVRGWQSSGVTAPTLAAEIATWPSIHEGKSLAECWMPGAPRAWAEALLAFDPRAMDAAITGELWAGLDPDLPLECPAVVLRADDALDPVFRPQDADRFAKAVPGATVTSVPGADHWLHVDRAGHEAVVNTVLDVLARAR